MISHQGLSGSIGLIRPYQKTDRQDVFLIAADTAFFGEPVEAYLDDRRLFIEAFYRYYTDFEPEHSWVACIEDCVVGFLVGCTNTNRKQYIQLSRILPQFALQIARGYYRIGSKTYRYLLTLAFALLRSEFPRIDLQLFPAHMHLNIARNWRGNGLGRQLWNAFQKKLYQEKVPGIHLHTTNRNKIACKFYESLGFEPVATRTSSIWSNLFGLEVINLCYAKSFEIKN